MVLSHQNAIVAHPFDAAAIVSIRLNLSTYPSLVLTVSDANSHHQSASVSGEAKLRQITISLRADETFPVPLSDGYSVYSSLLSVIDNVDSTVSARVHDSSLGSLHSSGLLGVFGQSDRSHHKSIRGGEPYELTLGVVNPDDQAIFQSLVSGLVLEGESLHLSHGSLDVETFESRNVTHTELLEKAADLSTSNVELQFRTTTCIEEVDDVTTMFPHRAAVFRSLLGKWNMTCPEHLELDIDRETLLTQVIEKPDSRTYDTQSVLVNRVTNEEGENRNLFRQGFTGTCEYAFKGASEAVENAVLALAMYGEYSGVGSAVARGCGNVQVEVKSK